MEMLPNVVGIKEIQEVGFYKYLRLKRCVLSGLSKELELSRPLPEPSPTKAVLVGRLHHRFMQLAACSRTTSEFENAIDREIQVLQVEVDRWPRLRRTGSVSGWDKVNVSADIAIRRLQRRLARDEVANSRSEHELRSRDGSMIGRPDSYAINGRAARLVEFKSTEGFGEDRSIRADIELQLHFYATLLYESFEIDTVTATAEFIDGTAISVDVPKSIAQRCREDVAVTVAAANARIREARSVGSLATPGANQCRRCDKRLICGRYMQAQSEIRESGASVQIDIKVLGVSENSVERAFVDGSDCFSARRWRLSIPLSIASKMSVGSSYVLAELSGTNESPQWGESSVAFYHDTAFPS